MDRPSEIHPRVRLRHLQPQSSHTTHTHSCLLRHYPESGRRSCDSTCRFSSRRMVRSTVCKKLELGLWVFWAKNGAHHLRQNEIVALDSLVMRANQRRHRPHASSPLGRSQRSRSRRRKHLQTSLGCSIRLRSLCASAQFPGANTPP